MNYVLLRAFLKSKEEGLKTVPQRAGFWHTANEKKTCSSLPKKGCSNGIRLCQAESFPYSVLPECKLPEQHQWNLRDHKMLLSKVKLSQNAPAGSRVCPAANLI